MIILTNEECTKLNELISWAINGTEHGVINYDTWKRKTRELVIFMKFKGMKPYGQWTEI